MSQKRQKISRQQRYRQTTYHHAQYWNLSYTERYIDGSERDFKTIIKARSYAYAKDFLILKLQEDDPDVTVKAISGFKFHKSYTLYHPVKKTLGIKEWEDIRAAAFPNENNVLFKLEVPRPDWKTNRFNGSGKNNLDHIRKYGFQSGEKNWAYQNLKGKSLKDEDTSHMFYRGKWRQWDEEDRENTKASLIAALENNNNHRGNTAQELGFNHRNGLYKLMKKFPEIDFSKDYPPPPRPGPPRFTKEEYKVMARKSQESRIRNGTPAFGGKSNTPEVNAKRAKSLRKHYKNLREKRIKEMEPKIRKALVLNNNIRHRAASYLKMDPKTLSKHMWLIKKEKGVDWKKEYPPQNSYGKK